MEKKGLCTTCVEFSACVFTKEPPVWQCEEFSNGETCAPLVKKAKVKKFASCQEAVEPE